MTKAILLAILVLAALPGAAAAQYYDQILPMTGSSPAHDGQISAVSTPVPWKIDGSLPNTHAPIDILVSTEPIRGTDGTLDRTYVQEVFSVNESATPGTYTGSSGGGAGRWQDTPGTYFWMAITRPPLMYRSSVFMIHVGGPAVESAPAPPEALAAPPPPAAPLPTAIKPAANVVVHSRAISHGHAKLRAQCTPAPCSVRTLSVVRTGGKWYPGTPTATTLTASVLQRLYVPLEQATLRVVRRALKRHRKAKLYVEVDTIDATGAVADRDYLVFAVTKISG